MTYPSYNFASMATSTPTQTGADEIHWDLTHLYQGNPGQGIDADLSRAQELTQEFESRYRSAVAGLNAGAMVVALRQLEEIHQTLGRAAAYAFLDFSIDVADPGRGALLQKVQESMTQTGAGLLFFSLEWLAVPDDFAATLLQSPELDTYRHYLESARRYRPYVLSEGEERVLAEKSVTARSSWDRLFEEVTTSVRVNIGDREATLDEALSLLHAGAAEERRSVAQAVTDALRGGLPVRKFVLNTILADKSIDDRLRSYPHWIADRNLANEASDESVQALVEAVTSRYDIPHRYFALKKKLLRLETLYDWDRYAPLDSAEPQVSWDEAKEIVLDAYGSFSPRMRELGSEFFDKNWIDAALGPNKRGGAYAHPAIPSLHPYVFINFTGQRRDVLVLAHELGHGVHMSLSRAQSYLNFETPLTTAETASIFGETVTFSRLLDAEDDPQRRLGLMVGRIDDVIATIFRQVAMNRFEDAIHNQRRASGELSEDDLNTMWLRTQRDMLGPAVEVSENYGIWWSYIPHFIGAPGYVYAYAFGNLLALAIYQRAVEEGPGFAPKYFDLLSAGGSDSPEALTAKLGVDLSDPAFWQGGLSQISTLVDEAEGLSQKL
jgi:oligoendopeptidase F